MSADALITRSLAYAKSRAEWKRKHAAQGAGQAPPTPPGQGPSTPPGRGPTAPPGTPSGQAQPDGAREHRAHEDLEPPADDDAPPPPDPEFDESPADERPEEVSEAEEPQATPAAPPAAPRTTRRSRNEGLALKALNAEADVQARIKMMTVGEHLGPISEAGDPPMTVLRDYLEQHRPAIIAQLGREGHTELAAYYRSAPTVEPQIQQRFAPYFEGASAGK